MLFSTAFNSAVVAKPEILGVLFYDEAVLPLWSVF